MEPLRKHKFVKFGLNILASLIATGIVASVTYYIARESITDMLRDGIALLEVDSTSKALIEIRDASIVATDILNYQESRPSRDILVGAKMKLEKLINSLGERRDYPTLKTILLYIPDWKEQFTKKYGKRLEEIDGLYDNCKKTLLEVNKELELADRELFQEPTVDVIQLRKQLSTIQQQATSAHTSLISRQSATLKTIRQFE